MCPRRNGSPVDESTFTHGVASGDPLPDSVRLWTRIEPRATEPVEVSWSVATDEALTNVVARGRAVSDPSADHTVRLDVGGLEPATTYFYAFDALGARSSVGRTRTLPAGRRDHVRFAVFSCAKFSAGYFNALGRIADRDDIDFVLCLGDYIYEYSNQDKGLGAKIGRAFEPDHRCVALEDYRTRYAQSRRDPDMQRFHARHPIIAMVDDHEMADDTWRDGAGKHDPETDGPWDERKAVAIRAWREWLPVRLPDPADPMRLYRHFPLGDLADLILLDTRTHRDRQAKGEEVERPDRTLLGAEQFGWFTEQLVGSRAAWRLVGNGVMIGQVKSDLMPEDVGDPLSELGVLTARDHGPEPDQWDGYPAERARLLNDIRDHGVRDVVFVSGDVHSAWACDLKLDPHDPEESSVAVEYCTTSVTSENLDDDTGWGYRTRSVDIEREIVDENPHIYFAELDSHGYLLVDVTRDRVQADWHFVDQVHRPSTGVRFADSYEVRRGEHRLRHVGRPVDSRKGTISGNA